MNKQSSFFVSEMTVAEVRIHIQRGGPVILVTGSTECHGDHLPLGTDTFIAQAVALEVARAADAIIFPPVWFTYSGGTRDFPGTISIPGAVEQAYTRAAMRSLIRDGSRKIIHLQWHAPYHNNRQVAREIFEETSVPVAFFGLMEMPVMRSPKMSALIGEDPFQRETTIAAGALALLGRPHLLLTARFQTDTQPEHRPEDAILTCFYNAGATVGHLYNHTSQHLPVRTDINEETGRRAIALLAGEIIRTIQPLEEYLEILKSRHSGREEERFQNDR